MEVVHLSLLKAPFETNLCIINNHFLSEIINVQVAAQFRLQSFNRLSVRAGSPTLNGQ